VSQNSPTGSVSKAQNASVSADLRNPWMLLFEIGVRSAPDLGRLCLELLALEAIPLSSFC